MTGRRWTGRVGVVLGGFALGLFVATAPAAADPDYGTGPTDNGNNQLGNGPADNLTWHNCTIVSGPQYIGGVCAGSGREGRTVKEILGKDPVPDCWDDPVDPDDLAAMGKHDIPGPEGYTHYWHRCLTGVDKKTKTLQPGGMHIDTTLITIPNVTPPTTLTHNQHVLVDGQYRRGIVPTPVAVVSPSDHPRVGLDVAYLDGSDGKLDVSPLGAVIHAYVDHIYVEPLGVGAGPTVDCPGTGKPARPGQTPVPGDGLCWYRYLRSSAGQPDDLYRVRITAHWVVEISLSGDAGTFERLDDFTKSGISRIPVTEVQALVVG
ncbi:MAG TPA: hypothetical protein VF416_04340 [Marmoricola sp.]